MKYRLTTLPWVISHTSTEGDDMNSQGYIQGSTVILSIEFYVASDTPAPVVPTAVTLDALVLEGATRITTSSTFTSPVPGTYTKTLDTATFPAGRYTWRFKATDSAGHVFLGEDDFVLLPATGPMS